MPVVHQYQVIFIHSKEVYRISYTIQKLPYKKEHLMYRLAFPLKNGAVKGLVVFKNMAGAFSSYSKRMCQKELQLLASALREIRRIESTGSQTIQLQAR